MENRMNKKSAAAILLACVCALIFLCASAAARPTKARAELFEETYTIAAFDSNEFDESGQTNCNWIWGTFYIGTEPLSTANWQNGGDSGTITFDMSTEVTVGNTTADGTIATATFSGNEYKWDDFTKDIKDTPLSADHTHDFIADAGNYYWKSTNSGHYAVCNECGFELEVAHRPDGMGVCKDCGESIVNLSDYENTYTFTIPDPEELNNSNGGNWEGNELTINISVDADLRAGDTLELYLVCSNVLTSESGLSKISYTMKVDSDIEDSTWVDDSLSGTDSEPIWSYQAPIPEEYDSDPDSFKENFMTTIQGTIIITLEIDNAEYPGTYTDELTFSVNILDYKREES